MIKFSRERLGRTKILTDTLTITPDNVVKVIQEAMTVHINNALDIQRLWDYYRGDQPVFDRTKDVRPEIKNDVLVNRAFEIVDFKTSYLTGEPVQYVLRGTKAKVDDVTTLNTYVADEGKEAKDNELVKWFHICGLGYRMVLPKTKIEDDEAPFEIFTLDPRTTFVVYANDLAKKPVLGVTYYVDTKGSYHYSAYSENRFYELTDDTICKSKPHIMASIPIIEYHLDMARMGAFEPVESILNAINVIESNRVDDIEQFVQSLLIFHNVDIDENGYDKLREKGAIVYRDVDPNMKGDIQYLTSTLQQGDTQTLVNNLMKAVREIVGVPSSSSGDTNDSSNNGAVVLKNGWQGAEYRAKDTELFFKQSEKRFLKIVLKICKEAKRFNLLSTDVDIRLPRRNYENILQKAQVLQMMNQDDKVHPKLAFEHCGMFADPDMAYEMSKKYAEEQEKKNEEKMLMMGNKVTDQDESQQGVKLDATKDYSRDAGVNPNPFEARKQSGIANRKRGSNDSANQKKKESN